MPRRYVTLDAIVITLYKYPGYALAKKSFDNKSYYNKHWIHMFCWWFSSFLLRLIFLPYFKFLNENKYFSRGIAFGEGVGDSCHQIAVNLPIFNIRLFYTWILLGWKYGMLLFKLSNFLLKFIEALESVICDVIKNTSKSISFLEVSFPTSPLIPPF